MVSRFVAPLVLAALLIPSLAASAAAPVEVVVAMEQSAYGADEALLEGVRGVAHASDADGGPLAGVGIDVVVFRTSRAGYVHSETISGLTDADGAFAFDASEAYELPGSYFVAAFVKVNGAEHANSTRYDVGAPKLG